MKTLRINSSVTKAGMTADYSAFSCFKKVYLAATKRA
jgi:hypothetical protein